MSHTNSRRLRTTAVALLVVVGLFIVSVPAFGLNKYLKTWKDHYPDSASGDAGCALCHGSSTKNLNAYGRDLCVEFDGSLPADIAPYLAAIEGLNSDGDGNSNLVEIDASAQPGWTTGDNAIYYGLDGKCAPTGAIIGVPAGPYSGHVDVPITFDGTSSYDSDGGSIVSYAWDFGDGTTGEGAVVEHTYTVADTHAVTLTVVDDAGVSNSTSTITTVSAESVVDLDIDTFKVNKSQKVNKPISILLSVENSGTVLGQAIATVVGMQGDVQVYEWPLNVYDYSGKGTTSFTFPSYTPTTKGTINWTATIADVDPDVDLTTATTVVK